MRPHFFCHMTFLFAALVVAVLVSGCNPCNDKDGEIMNVNDSAFSGPEFTVVTFNMLHGFGDPTNNERIYNGLSISSGGIDYLWLLSGKSGGSLNIYRTKN